MTQPPVVRESIYGSTTLRIWSRENTPALLSNWPEIKENGLIIVTNTYLTSRADINAWQNKSKKVAIGFEGSAVDAFEIAPSTSWHRASSDGGWIAAVAANVSVACSGGFDIRFSCDDRRRTRKPSFSGVFTSSTAHSHPFSPNK
jgi:hypothetical protein